MAAPLSKCLSLQTENIDHTHINDYLKRDANNVEVNRQFATAAGVSWIKFWVYWDDLQLQPASSIQESWAMLSSDPLGRLRILEEQIVAANADGRNVMLTTGRFAGWANSAGAENSLPNDRSTGGNWAWFIGWLISRYGSAANNPRGARIDTIEIVNEPNLGMFVADGTPITCAVAQMITSAEAMSYFFQSQGARVPGILAPALADVGQYQQMANNILYFLQQAGFQSRVPMVWTHHNYRDIKNGSQAGVSAIRNLLLQYLWTGRPDRHDIWLTEGGMEIDGFLANSATTATPEDQVTAQQEESNGKALVQNMTAMKNFPGVQLWTNHLINNASGAAFQSGLFRDWRPNNVQGAIRPAGVHFRDF